MLLQEPSLGLKVRSIGLRVIVGEQTVMSGAEEVLVSFRAGLMKPENNTLKADQRKGSIQLVQVYCPCNNVICEGQQFAILGVDVQSADGLTHFRWHERVGVEPKHPAQHDFIVFPGEAEFKKVSIKQMRREGIL